METQDLKLKNPSTMLLLAVLLLSSVVASSVITSVIIPPSDFKGDLGTIAEKINCRYECTTIEKDDEQESLWLWKEKNNCGVMCSLPDELGSIRPYNTTETEGLGSSTPTVDETSGTEPTAGV